MDMFPESHARITSRNKKKSGMFVIPPLFSPQRNENPQRKTPQKTPTSSRLPFSPLTNRSNERNRSASRSSSKEKRVLDFDSSIAKKSRTERSFELVSASTEPNPNADFESTSSLQGGQSQSQSQERTDEDEYEFIYPAHVRVSSSTIESAYKQAMKYGTHQQHLKSSNCNQLSFTEVMIPSIVNAHSAELKILEGKAKGRNAPNLGKKLKAYRCALMNCEKEMILNAEAVRKDRKLMKKRLKEEEEAARLEQMEEEAAREHKEKIARKEKRKVDRLKEKERRRKQKKKEYKKNRELWREVASLMAELGRIEKEEKIWSEVDLSGFAVKNVAEEKIPVIPSPPLISQELGSIQSIVDGISTSASRIQEAFQDLSSLLNKSEAARSELYQKYRNDHKFEGYRAHKNPKALIRALTLE